MTRRAWLLILIIVFTTGNFHKESVLAHSSLVSANNRYQEDACQPQLQLTHLIAQRAEFYFSGLNFEIVYLSQQVSIRTNQDVSFPVAIKSIENVVTNRGEVISSVTRFNTEGMPYYAYPEEMNNLITEETNYPYDIPDVLKMEAQETFGGNIETGIYRVERQDHLGEYTYLLIAPVITLQEKTEFLVYELNMNVILADLTRLVQDQVTNYSTGQLWVLDYDSTVDAYVDIYAMRDDLSIDTIRESYSNETLDSVDEVLSQTYTYNQDGQTIERDATLTRFDTINHEFILFLSHDPSEEPNLAINDICSDQVLAAILMDSYVGSYFQGLNIEIAGLSQQVSIRTSHYAAFPVALTTIEGVVSNRGNVIRSATRFDGNGEPLYAYPKGLNDYISRGDTFPYSLPNDLVQQAQVGEANSLPDLYRIERNDIPGVYSYFLIASVFTLNETTEFLVFEVNIGAIFEQILTQIQASGVNVAPTQWWLLDYDEASETHVEHYAMTDDPTIDTIWDSYSTEDLNALDSATTQTYIYNEGGKDIKREITLIRVETIGRNFILIFLTEV